MKGRDNTLVHVHSTQKKTPIYGFIACGRSVMGIYEDLVEQPAAPCRYLLTYKLSQDHLELFFSAVRARGGYNNNPNVRQFPPCKASGEKGHRQLSPSRQHNLP